MRFTRNTLFYTFIMLTMTFTFQARAAILAIENCSGNCSIVTAPENTVIDRNPNNETLIVWNEVQNILLTEDLEIDVVADLDASYIRHSGNRHYIKAGTMISSHHIQWDNGSAPGNQRGTIMADLLFDAQIYGMITTKNLLSHSDAMLGLPGYEYRNFGARGLERNDKYSITGMQANVELRATSPGDWTRFITAASPFNLNNNNATEVPAPPSLALFLIGAVALSALRRR